MRLSDLVAPVDLAQKNKKQRKQKSHGQEEQPARLQTVKK